MKRSRPSPSVKRGTRPVVVPAAATRRLGPALHNELYEFVPVGFLTLDRSGRILELNERAARLIGFDAAWLTGRPFIVFVATGDVRRFLAFMTRSLQEVDQETIE